MTRIALGIEYDGSGFKGWQSQAGLRSVQAEVESALSFVANEPVEIFCAGRTDAGVHALEQVVHFNTEVERPFHAWVLGANALLPRDVIVLWSRCVDENFHARFSALSRRYRYIILNRKVRSAITRNRETWIPYSLNSDLMHQAAQSLIGEHDFSSFRAADCQSKTSTRRVGEISVRREGDRVIIDITANAFLHHMVRNIVGVLLEIGREKRPVSWTKDLLVFCDRTKAGITAPACGLYLVSVKYIPILPEDANF